MDDFVDFEELIDLVAMSKNESTSQNSSQEPLSNVLDKMCEEIGESSLIDDTIECGQVAKDETLIDLDEFEEFLNTNCVNVEARDTDIENNIPIEPYELPIDFDEAQPWVNKKLSLTETNACETNGFVGFGFVTNNENTENVNVVNYFDILKPQDELEIDKVTEFKIIDANLTEDIIDLDDFLSDDEIEAAKQEMLNKNNIIIDIYSDDGYNSSDFEFISEDEAKKIGIVTKSTNKAKTTNTQTYPNEAPPSEYMKYSKYRYMPCYAKSSADFHEIPTGEKYLDMFRGQFAPMVINNLHFARHKTVLPNTPMAAMYDDLGFTISDHFDENEEEYKEDADACVQKILSEYPAVNRKRRRF